MDLQATAVILLIGLVSALAGGCGDEEAERELPFAQELQDALDAGLEAHGGKGFSVAVIMSDGAKWVGVSGVSHGTTPVTPDMPFAAGSITKTWTAATILELAEEEVLSLEDPLSAWLPAYPNVDSTITIRQLLSHTGGVYNFTDHPDYWQEIVWDDPGRTWAPEETISTFLLEPYFPKGTDWHYSNSGYALLRMIITEATGSEISTEYRNRFWDPLGLDRTVLSPEEELPENTAHGWWDLDGDGNYDDFASVPRTAFSSGTGGQVFSTAEDLADWARALYHERSVLDEQSFNAMTTFRPVDMPEEPLLAGYGLGAVRFNPELFNDLEVWGMGGNAPGYAAGSFYLPDYGVSLGFADNTEEGDAMGTLDDLMSILMRNVEDSS
jgi:D-alanyl-D-alanine carboxypeptidase